MVIIGGGVAGYAAAIKAGQEGMKVCAAILAPSLSPPKHP
ncbi:FAD-binding protein [Candidatus Bathyarchaeota archaeon]|nr:FAD-binding protein [Candidatus Bathyarchaeota archaeon]